MGHEHPAGGTVQPRTPRAHTALLTPTLGPNAAPTQQEDAGTRRSTNPNEWATSLHGSTTSPGCQSRTTSHGRPTALRGTQTAEGRTQPPVTASLQGTEPRETGRAEGSHRAPAQRGGVTT